MTDLLSKNYWICHKITFERVALIYDYWYFGQITLGN